MTETAPLQTDDHGKDHTTTANRLMALALGGFAVAMLALMIVAGMQVDGVLRDFRQRFIDQHYVEVDGRTITIEDTITQPTLIYAQHVTLANGSDASVAIYGGDAVIEGTIKGDVAFLGDALDIAPGAVIDGDLTLDVAKHVTIRGTITGAVHGGADRMYGDPKTDQGT